MALARCACSGQVARSTTASRIEPYGWLRPGTRVVVDRPARRLYCSSSWTATARASRKTPSGSEIQGALAKRAARWAGCMAWSLSNEDVRLEAPQLVRQSFRVGVTPASPTKYAPKPAPDQLSPKRLQEARSVNTSSSLAAQADRHRVDDGCSRPPHLDTAPPFFLPPSSYPWPPAALRLVVSSSSAAPATSTSCHKPGRSRL